jgi:hypothetical protein
MDYYKIMINIVLDDVFDIARLKSGTIASHIKDNAGNSQEQALAITDAERDLWNINIREPADKVYSYLMQAGKIREGTYDFNVTPIAYNNGAGVITGADTAIDVAANDNLPAGVNIFALVGTLGGAKHAVTVTINATTGIINYVSAPGYIGSDTVNYQITDATGVVSFATVYILVGATAVVPSFPASSNLVKYTLYITKDWDINLAQGLTNLIQKALVSGGMYEWYKSAAQFDVAKIYQQEYMEALEGAKQNINRRAFTLRRPHVTF